jgi:hypothetical protein
MTNLTLRDPLREFAAALRFHEVVPVAEFEAGLVHLEAEIERIALDAYTARRRGLTFAEAATDFVNFPQLARIHAAMDDILTMSLPPPLVAWVKSLVSMPEPPSFEGMRTALVVAAGDGSNPHLQALAHFTLFEGVRLNLVLLARWFPHETFGVGMDLVDLDRNAEQCVAGWLTEEPADPEGVRPFHLIVSAAMRALNEHAEQLRAGLANLQQDFVEEARRRAEIEEVLGEMDVKDALLIRNEMAPDLDEQRLTVDLLQDWHMLVLGDVSRNALDQRVQRARTKGRAGLRRRRVALLDILRESATVGGAR